ncbi:MAG: hypothetical protein IPN34_09710 [Planctomycetes bacterium]|nr:hypothetical protein [Planctomycetota bacterium]
MSPRRFRSSAALLLGWIATSFAPLEAQGVPRLFLDLETQIANSPCSQRVALGSAVAGGVALFSVRPNGGGNQLWRSDGSASGTQPLRDFDPLWFAGREPRQMVFSNGLFFFNHGVDGYGDKLWCSDGTVSGTRYLGNLNSGVRDSHPIFFAPFGLGILFQANDEIHGAELWFSDGTESGTRLVADLVPGPGTSWPGPFAVLGGVAVFPTFDGRVWRTDGTAAGTFELGAALGLSVPQGLGRMESFAGRVWFAGRTAASGTELWATDGSIRGTTLVYELAASTLSSDPKALSVVGGLLYFAAGAPGITLAYVTDGVQSVPTVLRSVAQPASLHVEPRDFIGVGGRVFFSASRGDVGRELWTTDGTAAGTRLVADLRPGVRGSEPRSFARVAGKLLFRADDGSSGSELWVSDGTTAGTTMVRDLAPGSASSDAGLVLELSANAALFFTGEVQSFDQLWRTDGTTAGTQIVRSFCPLAPSSAPSPPAGDPSSRGFFSAFVGGQRELWRTDGTTAGSRRLWRGATTLIPWQGAMAGTKYVFYGWDSTTGEEPWVSDGTPTGTQQLADLIAGSTSSMPFDFVSLGAEVLFAANDSARGRELWISDGTPVGTRLFADLVPGISSSRPRGLIRCGKLVFFLADLPGAPGPTGLWRTDGTVTGTVPLSGLSGVPDHGSVSNLDPLIATPNEIFFASPEGLPNAGLWRSDGTVGGTLHLSTAIPTSVAYGANGAEYVWWRDALWFVSNSAASGYEIWTSDGTSAGTRIAFELAPGNAHFSPRLLGALGDRIYFSADDGVHGRELWSSTGTASGTSMLLDLVPGSEPGVPMHTWFLALPAAQRALFLANDGVHGVEIWRTDGTPAGTVLQGDLRPGPLSITNSRPQPPVLIGSTLLFTADDGVHGVELFALEAMALAVPFGFGCAAAPHAAPRLESFGTPSLGNARHALEVRSGTPFAWSQILVSPTSGFETLSAGCALWLDPLQLFLASEQVLDAQGSARIGVPIPADPVLQGALAFAQVVVRDPLAPPPGLALSAGLQVIVASN